jgi:hypothetical protein
MKTPGCVEMKNKIQAEIVRDYAAVPKAEWTQKQADELAKSQSPIADFWRRLQPAQKPMGVRVAEAGAGYGAEDQAK